MCAQDRQRLIDAVRLVRLEFAEALGRDELVDPARIEIDVEARAATVLRQVLDRQAQAARPGRSEHQPVGAARKRLVGEPVAEDLVVGLKVADIDPALRHAGRASGLEDVERLAFEPLRHPAADRPAAQPFIPEVTEFFQIVVTADRLARIEVESRSVVEPERRAAGRIEVPAHGLAHVRVERRACLSNGGNVRRVARRVRHARLTNHRPPVSSPECRPRSPRVWFA